MELPKKLKETVISFNEEDLTAEVFTYNKPMLRQLEYLSKKRPVHVHYISNSGDGANTYTIPKTWLKIRSNRLLYAMEQMQKNRPFPAKQTVYRGANGGNRTHDLLITSELLYL